MRPFLSLTLTLVALPFLGSKEAPKAAVDSLVASERAFAADAQVQGVQAAFLSHFAQDALIFRPGPVPAQAWLTLHPIPPIRLNWGPSFAEISASGELGWTTGPSTIKEKDEDPEPKAFGHFVSIWKRQADGNWKVAVDLGINHPKPEVPSTFATRSPLSPSGAKAAQMPVDPLSLDKGLRLDQFPALAAPDLRIYRSGQYPLTGADLSKVLASLHEHDWEPMGGGASNSGDLAYSYGRVQSLGDGKPLPCHYLHIWRREPGQTWKLVLDIVVPGPPAKS